ncbi:MAG: HD domain-containing protein [Chloroflexota bacterium]
MVAVNLTDRFGQALQYAFELHREQRRKGSDTPYMAHLLGVASLVLEDGGDEDSAIAALFHDAVEDQGGLETLEKIRKRFGERVAEIVDSCTDSYEIPKPPWRGRKERYLAHLRQASADARRVALADKLYNARSILYDLERIGDDVWGRFRGGKEGTLWYYQSLVESFRDDASVLAGELTDVVERIMLLAEDAQSGV